MIYHVDWVDTDWTTLQLTNKQANIKVTLKLFTTYLYE